VKQLQGNPFDPPASRLKPAIQFLRRLDVPASRVAHALGETADNIRHIDVRSYEEAQEISLPVSITDVFSTPRSRFDPSDISKNKLEELEEEIQSIRKVHGTAHLASGYQKLRKLLPYVSIAQRPYVVRVRSVLEENLAWFSCHLGFAQTAYFYAEEAMNHRTECYRRSSLAKEHLTAYARIALIASNALRISHRPLMAMEVLNAAYEAKFTAGEAVGSEWYRQLATALFQLRIHDDLARKLYLKAGREMESSGEYSNPVSVQMNCNRQQNLLNPNSGWENGLEVVASVKTAFGEFSLEHVMAINWAAAAGFALDSHDATQLTQELLLPLIGRNLPFEHQGTATKLLSITPKLNLRGDILDRWIRFALYQNAARSK
jgi:hypothetical protein